MPLDPAASEIDKHQYVGSGHHPLQQLSMQAPIRALHDHPLPRDVNYMNGHAVRHLKSVQGQH
jgi:hypothetical protein